MAKGRLYNKLIATCISFCAKDHDNCKHPKYKQLCGRFKPFWKRSIFIKSLPNDKILHQSKLKEFADVKINQIHFTPIQIESICRRQNKPNSSIVVCVQNDRKHCGKRRKCWLPAFSTFPTMFSKGISYGVVKSFFCG